MRSRSTGNRFESRGTMLNFVLRSGTGRCANSLGIWSVRHDRGRGGTLRQRGDMAMETLYVALDNFSYVFGDHGRVRSFKAGEVLSDSLVALFGTATVPVVKQSEQDCYWWCSACRSLHDLDPETCTVDHRTPIWRVPAPIRCAIPTGGVRSYEMGQHIFDPLDVQALRGTNVPVEAVEDAALCALVCNNCGARYRRVIAADRKSVV